VRKINWLSKEDRIVNISYELIVDFDKDGNPIYKKGTVKDKKEIKLVQDILEPLQPKPATFASVTMGKICLKLANNKEIIIEPVYHPSLHVYKDLFKVGSFDFIMPESFAKLLNKWRNKLIKNNP